MNQVGFNPVTDRKAAGHSRLVINKTGFEIAVGCNLASGIHADHVSMTDAKRLDLGVSGSPIIQNGKLIGVVTHVLVNDPTTGYGIFIENMLDAAA